MDAFEEQGKCAFLENRMKDDGQMAKEDLPIVNKPSRSVFESRYSHLCAYRTGISRV